MENTNWIDSLNENKSELSNFGVKTLENLKNTKWIESWNENQSELSNFGILGTKCLKINSTVG